MSTYPSELAHHCNGPVAIQPRDFDDFQQNAEATSLPISDKSKRDNALLLAP